MKKLLCLVILCFFLQGCYATYKGAVIKTDNTFYAKVSKKEKKQKLKIIITTENPIQFSAILNEIAKLFKEHGK